MFWIYQVIKDNTTRVIYAAAPILVFSILIATDSKIIINCFEIIREMFTIKNCV